MGVSLSSSHVPFIQRLARAESHLITAVSTLGEMHQCGVVHGDVAHTNVMCSMGSTTLVDIGNLAQEGTTCAQGFRALYAHPDQGPHQPPAPARMAYDVHAAGMLVLTAGIASGIRELYVSEHSALGDDWEEVRRMKAEGSFVRLSADNCGRLEDTAANVVESYGLEAGSGFEEAVVRLRRRFQWGLALLGQEPPIEAMRDPRQFVRSFK